MKLAKQFKSLSRIFRNYTPRKLAITLLGLAAVITPLAIFAAAPSTDPTFTWSNKTGVGPAPYTYFNAITDNPYWGNENNFAKILDANGNDVSGANVQNGQTYYLEMLVHNDGNVTNDAMTTIENTDVQATNTKVGFSLDNSSYVTQLPVYGSISASDIGHNSQINEPGTYGIRSTSAVFTGSTAFKLNYVSGSATYITQFTGNDYTSGGKTFTLPNSAVNSSFTGSNPAQVAVGYDSMDGTIAGCWEHHGLFVAEFKVQMESSPTPQPSYNIKKSVSQSGNNLNYSIVATNTGDVDLTNVKIHDSMNLSNASGMPTNFELPSGVTETYPDFTIAKLSAGQTVNIKYTVSASVTNITNYCGINNGTVANAVTSSNDQNIGESNKNDNSTSSTVSETDNSGCTHPTPAYNLVKSVDKTSAKPGDTLRYTLTFYNLGNEDLTNVVIKDSLPKGVTLVGNVNAAANDASGISDLAKLFTDGVKISTVHPGGTVTITYSVTVNENIMGVSGCQGGSANVTNTSNAVTDQSKTETTTKDNDTTTTVTLPSSCVPTNPTTPASPTSIAATGPVRTIATLLAVGALTFGLAAYLNSRHAIKLNAKK